jgi:hypothetical protein
MCFSILTVHSFVARMGRTEVVASIGNPDGAESIECQLDPFPSMDRDVLQEIWLEGLISLKNKQAVRAGTLSLPLARTPWIVD